MASLASVTPGSSYPGLIKTIGNGALTTCTQLSDGAGNALAITISPSNCGLNLGSPNNLVTGCNAIILGGTGNCALGLYSIASGINSCAVDTRSITIGFCNAAFGSDSIAFGACSRVKPSAGLAYALSTISGGYLNAIESSLSFVGSGIVNRICGGSCNAIVGGEQNTILQCYPSSLSTNFIGAGRYNAITSSVTNCVNSIHSVIAGGCTNIICGVQFGTIPGGAFNRVDNAAAVVVGGGIAAGGAFNTVSSDDGSIFSGRANLVTGCKASIIGGICNTASGCCSGIFNGCCNIVSSGFSSVLGGSNNNSCLAYSGVFGCGITSSMACAFHTNRLVVTQLPSSSAGLPSGALWYDPADSNLVKYVP